MMPFQPGQAYSQYSQQQVPVKASQFVTSSLPAPVRQQTVQPMMMAPNSMAQPAGVAMPLGSSLQYPMTTQRPSFVAPAPAQTAQSASVAMPPGAVPQAPTMMQRPSFVAAPAQPAQPASVAMPPGAVPQNPMMQRPSFVAAPAQPQGASFVAAPVYAAAAAAPGAGYPLTATARRISQVQTQATLGPKPLPESMIKGDPNPKNNLILMTDGYKFSHHKQYPVSWMPPHARPVDDQYFPPILFPGTPGKAKGTCIQSMRAVPTNVEDPNRTLKITIVTNVSTAVVEVEAAGPGDAVDFTFSGKPLVWTKPAKPEITVAFDAVTRDALRLPQTCTKVKFFNVDESKLKRGSNLNANFEGGYNVSYFTPRAYSDMFSDLQGQHIVFFGLQYFIKEYLLGKIITPEKIEAADAFIGRFMADVRVAGTNFEDGYDYTMFPRGDWEAMATGDYDGTGAPVPQRAGVLPIKIEALPEGTLQEPGVCSFKITNTHPRFYWLPNFLETLLVQVWYPMSVATQAREFKKTIQAYSILSQRKSNFPAELGPADFTEANIAEDQLSIHLAQVFDLLDFGYRGVSSHETASLGSASYYTAGFEGSDTVAGSRMLLHNYNYKKDGLPDIVASFKGNFEQGHAATSVPAAEHSTITSWADVSPDADYILYEQAEYSAFTNMIKQYMASFCVSLVSDGFNIWNAATFLWPSAESANGSASMRDMLAERLAKGQLTILRPDSGEGIETLPQLLTILHTVLNEHWEAEPEPLQQIFEPGSDYEAKYNLVVDKVRAILGMADGNPFRRFVGQQFRVLQGDGVALDTVGDMLASMLANGFCGNCVNFGSGGGLLQKLNRDSLAVAFKCCAMYVGGECYPVGKDPIAGGKKSYGGNPAVIRGPDGILRNRGEYDEKGDMITSLGMSYEEFISGVPGDELKLVFENGVMVEEQNFTEVKERCKITDLDAAIKKAVDNLALKMDFFQKMTAPEAIAVRFAEACTGSKWKHRHNTKLADLKEMLPAYAPVFEQIGITADMDSVQVLDHIKDNYVLDKKGKKAIFRALADDNPGAAMDAMAGKIVMTL